MDLVAVVARSLWLQQNAVVFGQPVSSLSIVASKAVESLEAFRSTKARQNLEEATEISRNIRW
jgi:hypothetical protein